MRLACLQCCCSCQQRLLLSSQAQDMDAIMAECLQSSGDEVWELDAVKRRRVAVLERGAQDRWLMRAGDLQLRGVIGKGTFGQTYEAIWRGKRVRSARACLI